MAGWMSTKSVKYKLQFNLYPDHIIQKINLKRKLKYKWQKQKTPSNKKRLNAITKEVNS